jgi:hypothetical protein
MSKIVAKWINLDNTTLVANPSNLSQVSLVKTAPIAITASLATTASYSLSASLSNNAVSASYSLSSSNASTASFALSSIAPFTSSYLTTQSFNNVTSSMQVGTASFALSAIAPFTSSYVVTASGALSNLTASYALTAAFAQNVNTVFTSSYLTTQSFNQVSSSFATTISLNLVTASVNTITGSLNSHTASLNSFTSSINQATSSFTLTSSFNNWTGSVFTPLSSSFLTVSTSYVPSAVGANNSLTASIANTASYVKFGQVDLTTSASGNMYVNGNATISGTLTAQTFQTQLVSASILFMSGSTTWGITGSNTHTMTGSVYVSGSAFTWNNNTVITNNVLNGVRIQEMFPITTLVSQSGFITLSNIPSTPANVNVNVVGGLKQINASSTGSSGVVADFIVNGTSLYFNNQASTGLSGDINTGDVLIVDYNKLT